VCRVYLGSFWDNPLRLEENRLLLEREKADLLDEMNALPQGAVVRRINELVKRARSVKVCVSLCVSLCVFVLCDEVVAL
jgi:EH domain-containing protein 1